MGFSFLQTEHTFKELVIIAVYTFVGNTDEKKNGQSALDIASGICKLGDSLDFTAAEYNLALQTGAVLTPGTVTLASVRGTGPGSVFPFPLVPPHVINKKQMGR